VPKIKKVIAHYSIIPYVAKKLEVSKAKISSTFQYSTIPS
jgi:hypothetical protein